jgi:hypothetical protein
MKVRGQSPGGEGTTSLKIAGFFWAIAVPVPTTLIRKKVIINSEINTDVFFIMYPPFLRAPKNIIRPLDYTSACPAYRQAGAPLNLTRHRAGRDSKK